MSSIVDELQRIAQEAAQLRERLGELARACAQLRAELADRPRDEDDTLNAPRKLQSVS